MTDTRKYIDEQFDQFFEFDTDDKSTVTSTSCKLFAEHIHAACQSLNDKRIENYKSAYETWQDKTEWVQETSTAKELGLHRADVLKKRIAQLLAVIELQRNAMQEAVDCGMVPISSAKEGGAARYSQQVIVADKIRSAIALQPSDVELSDIGYISEDGEEVFLAMGLPLDAETCGVPVTNLYTIKTKANTK